MKKLHILLNPRVPENGQKQYWHLLENDTLRLTVSENEKNLAKDKWTIQKNYRRIDKDL